MELLVTGGFGYIGYAVLKEAYKRGHSVTVFEKLTKDNKIKAKKYKKLYDKLVYGDIENLKDINSCVSGNQVIIHLASLVPPKSEIDVAKTHIVNVKGLENVINSIIISKQNIKLIHISSFSLLGYTQDQQVPIKIENIYKNLDCYSHSKGQCEKMLDISKIEWCVMRPAMVLGHVRDISIELLQQLFAVPLDYRVETVIDLDVATAILNGAEMLLVNKKLIRQKLFISGGKELGHQHIYSEFIDALFASRHLKSPAIKYFTKEKTYGDWFDSSKSQHLLQYQKTSFNDYLVSLGGNNKTLGIISPIINYFLTMKLELKYQKKLKKLK